MLDEPAATEWSVVIPVKTSAAKSRFGPGDNSELARAMALDTVEAARAASGVAEVIVVTSAAFSTDFEALGARVVADPQNGLIPAILHGLAEASPGLGVAVLLGDLPAMTSSELGDALLAASRQSLGMVADADGDGTVLVTAAAGQAHLPAFGTGSRAAHAAAGYVELDGSWPGLKRDVDTHAHLAALVAPGPRTVVYRSDYPDQ